MKKENLTSADHALICSAHDEFNKKTQHGWHGVSAAVRLKSGEVFSSLVLEAEVPALTVCAEPVLIGKILNIICDDPVETIVATRLRENTDHKVIPPCGRCREFITDYCKAANVIVYDDESNALCKVAAVDLLPFKYNKAMPESP